MPGPESHTILSTARTLRSADMHSRHPFQKLGCSLIFAVLGDGAPVLFPYASLLECWPGSNQIFGGRLLGFGASWPSRSPLVAPNGQNIEPVAGRPTTGQGCRRAGMPAARTVAESLTSRSVTYTSGFPTNPEVHVHTRLGALSARPGSPSAEAKSRVSLESAFDTGSDQALFVHSVDSRSTGFGKQGASAVSKTLLSARQREDVNDRP